VLTHVNLKQMQGPELGGTVGFTANITILSFWTCLLDRNTGMHALMLRKQLVLGEGLGTIGACERLLNAVARLVPVQVLLGVEARGTPCKVANEPAIAEM
jgi:hypothetical protein